MMISSISVVSAIPTVSIFTEKEIYSYGDFLTFTIEVSEITGEPAILHIIDESGKKSSAIPIPITKLKTQFLEQILRLKLHHYTNTLKPL